MRAVEELKAQKQLSEQPEEEGTSDGSGARADGDDSTSTATFNMQQVSCSTLLKFRLKLVIVFSADWLFPNKCSNNPI